MTPTLPKYGDLFMIRKIEMKNIGWPGIEPGSRGVLTHITHLAVCNFWRDKKSYLLAALYKKLVTLQSYQLFTERTVTNFLQSAQSALS